MKLSFKNCISFLSLWAGASTGFNTATAVSTIGDDNNSLLHEGDHQRARTHRILEGNNDTETAMTDCQSNEYQQNPCVDVTVDDDKAVVIGKYVKNTDGIQVDSFLGIQYATQERFEPSELLLTKGVVQATEMGPACAQPESAWSGASAAEDCLYLNIWRPTRDENNDQDLLPVMFWIHGGGFIFGSGNHPNFDGANLAGNENVIVITMNYRLNIFGFMPAGNDYGTGGMNGILDQIQALKWVKEHISSFGGDPDKVTIFGESAGAISACQLSVIPQAEGLFQRAIMESGFCGFVPFHEATLNAGLESLDCATPSCGIEDLKDLQEYSTDVLLQVNAEHAFQPVHDKNVVPSANPMNLFSEGSNINPTDMIIGSNTYDDYNLFFVPMENYIKIADIEETSELSQASEDLKSKVLTLYSPTKYDDSSLAAYAQFRGDFDFGCPSRELATTASAAINGKVYSYVFAALSGYDFAKASGLLEAENINDATWASHEAEIPFVFGNTIALEGKPNVTYPSSFTNGEMVLVKEMMSRWAAFARTGNPQVTSSSESSSPSSSVEWTPVSDVSAAADPAYMKFGLDGGAMVNSNEEKTEQCAAMLEVYVSLSEGADADGETPLSTSSDADGETPLSTSSDADGETEGGDADGETPLSTSSGGNGSGGFMTTTATLVVLAVVSFAFFH